MNIWMTLQKARSLYPDKIGVIDGDKRFTYEQVGARVDALARFFKSSGIQAKERISILEINSHSFLEAYFAAAGCGTILNPINYRLAAKEISFILNDSDSKWLIVHSDFAPEVEGVLKEDTPLKGIIWIGSPPTLESSLIQYHLEDVIKDHAGTFEPEAIQEDDIAHLYYTSGTTGRPKGVMLTHKNVCLHALGTIAELNLCDTDIWGHIAPMFHLADAWATFAITWAGGTHVMVGRFEPETVMSTIEKEKITLSNMIPTMLNLMIKHPNMASYDFSSFRVVLSGGAPIAPELVRSIMEAFGCDYIQTYGMTETSPYLTFSLLKDHLKKLPKEEQFQFKAKTGRPCMVVDLKVVDASGVPVAMDDRQVGEILVRGDTITPGYWNRPEETEKSFHQGWLKTGDLAVMDDEGYVNIVDRKKDMIISGGENVFSIEVENVLYMNQKVLETAVFGMPHEKWGEAVTAAVVLKPGETATEQELIDFCKEHIASYKSPKSIVFIEELPKTGSGKITKKALRDQYNEL